MRQIIDVNARQWTNILKLMDEIEKWDFDVFEYVELLGDDVLVHFAFRLF